MPSGWEKKYTSYGKLYYVNHNTKTTHWKPPSTPKTALIRMNTAFNNRNGIPLLLSLDSIRGGELEHGLSNLGLDALNADEDDEEDENSVTFKDRIELEKAIPELMTKVVVLDIDDKKESSSRSLNKESTKTPVKLEGKLSVYITSLLDESHSDTESVLSVEFFISEDESEKIDS